MDDGEAMHIFDMEGIVGKDLVIEDPMTSSSHAKKEPKKRGKEKEQKSSEAHEVELLIRRKREEVLSSPSDYTIYRVPKTLFQEKSEAYVPHRVSIGPIYHGWQHLQPMEAHKMQYLEKFLNRKSGAATNLCDYIKAVRELEGRAYQCYPDLKIDRNSFVTMMVVDGCFILELLLQQMEDRQTLSEQKWSVVFLQDLIMLENQLPIFVLEALYKVFINGDDVDDDNTWTLYGLMCNYFVPELLIILGKEDKINCTSRDIQKLEPPEAVAEKPKNLLDFVRQFLIQPLPIFCIQQPPPPADDQKCFSDLVPAACAHVRLCGLCLGSQDPIDEEDYPLLIPDKKIEHIRCATELEKAGVNFEKTKLRSLRDIKFKNGVLTIPCITIHYGTDVILRNLIAYEQYIEEFSYITEYVAFMDGLIDSPQDVELLQKNGIIVTLFGDPSDVARLFNNLLKDVTVPFYFTVNVRHKVKEYYNMRCHKWKASLMRNYFNSPWSFISVVAAIILIAFTIIQTIYAVLAYHHH
ncbi:UPF0481 protein At3g47200-like [Macadamia integrifolia]|uniref:UPF0481 protein At3g47200-like n=1 Tax=Macadamia integrifolia TaxID=60698 RepID=UPI001C4F8828|nr:UPF0481 protein At3g47200-like [Macadamia integrifolia]